MCRSSWARLGEVRVDMVNCNYKYLLSMISLVYCLLALVPPFLPAAEVTIETVINNFTVFLDGKEVKQVNNDDTVTINTTEGDHILRFVDRSDPPLFEDEIINVTTASDPVTVLYFPKLLEDHNTIATITVETEISDVLLFLDDVLTQAISHPGATQVSVYRTGALKVTLQDRNKVYGALTKNLSVIEGETYKILFRPDEKISSQPGSTKEKKYNSQDQTGVVSPNEVIIYRIKGFK